MLLCKFCTICKSNWNENEVFRRFPLFPVGRLDFKLLCSCTVSSGRTERIFIHSDQYFKVQFFQDCLFFPEAVMMIDAIMICLFRSVVVCLCFLGKKQGYDHPPPGSPSVFFYIHIYIYKCVWGGRSSRQRPFECTDNLIFRGNLFCVR